MNTASKRPTADQIKEITFGCGCAALVQPIITMQPLSQTNVVGSTLTLSVKATGTLPQAPMAGIPSNDSTASVGTEPKGR